jgi:general secretion pathway protein N
VRFKDRIAQQALETRRQGLPRLMRRLGIVGALFLVFVMALAPASLLGYGLKMQTQGQLGLTQTKGMLWEGQGLLVARDTEGLWQPILSLEWVFEPSALLRGHIVWRLSESGRPVARMALHLGGLRLEHLRIDLPLRVFLGTVPHAMAQAGWRGDLRVQSPALNCHPMRGCSGHLDVLWRNGGVDIAPHQPFGDYRLSIEALGLEQAFRLETLPGSAIRLEGEGRLAPSGPRWQITVEGPPDIVDRLPNVMGPLARRGPQSGQARLEMPLRP